MMRHLKHFVIDRNGKHDAVSIDRLKPAYLEGLQQHYEDWQLPLDFDNPHERADEDGAQVALPAAPLEIGDPPDVEPPLPLVDVPVQQPARTRAGREIRPPARLNL
jgi:hypothetical protein